LHPFVERLQVPVHQNQLVDSREAARSILRGDLRLHACFACGFVTNLGFDVGLLDYGATYDNDQSWSERFESYVDTLVDGMIASGVRRRRVVEIGCGKGYFLTRLCERGDNTGVGVDATYVGPARSADGRVSFLRELYSERHAELGADVILCRHVIEHVIEPMRLIRSVRRSLEKRPGARVYFETPELRWILENLTVQDFFYEHCSYFTADSLAFAFRAAGFEVLEVQKVFEGQYLWLSAECGAAGLAMPSPTAADIEPLLRRYLSRETEVLTAWRERLATLRSKGRVAVWGAGAKGVTFLGLLDPRAELVEAVVDVNPRKQGRFLPGTGHSIISPEDLAARGIRSAWLMNRNYEAEVKTRLQEMASSVELLTEGDW
jgi:SAM-dependent methyltransferase